MQVDPSTLQPISKQKVNSAKAASPKESEQKSQPPGQRNQTPKKRRRGKKRSNGSDADDDSSSDSSRDAEEWSVYKILSKNVKKREYQGLCSHSCWPSLQTTARAHIWLVCADVQCTGFRRTVSLPFRRAWRRASLCQCAIANPRHVGATAGRSRSHAYVLPVVPGNPSPTCATWTS